MQVERYLPRTGWRASAELTGGGVMIDGGIHLVDLMIGLGGFPLDVYALAPTQVFRDADGEDGLVVMARLPGEAVGLLHYSMGTSIGRERQRATVTGTLGDLSFSPYGRSVVLETSAGRRRIALAEGGRGIRQMVGEFAGSLREGRRPLMSGPEALADLAVVLAAYRSAELGRQLVVKRP
jgi:predicted dehydrogenase